MLFMRPILFLTAVMAIDPAGDYQGTLEVGPSSLRLVLHVTASAPGSYSAKLDSIDQGAMGLPVEKVTLENAKLRLDLPKLRATYDAEFSADGKILKGTWTQGGIALPLEFRKTEKPFELRRPQAPAAPLPYKYSDVTVPNDAAKLQLAGTLTIPPGKGPFPGVVLISGSGPQDRDESLMGHKPFLVLADHLTRRGIAVLRYDDRGIGESTGDFAKATTLDFASDAEAAVKWLAGRPEVDPRKVGIIGHSEGGLIAPIVAARNQAVAFLVLLAGTGVPGDPVLLQQSGDIILAAGGTAEAAEQNRERQRAIFRILRENKDPSEAGPKLEGLLASAGLSGAGLKAQVGNINSPWFRQFIDLDPALYLSKTRVPVLALNGELDLQVNASINLPAIRRALTAAGNKDYEAVSLPKLNHLFQHASTGLPNEYGKIEETMAPEVLDRISAWILKRSPSPAK